jgi:hypothetical protein
LHGGPSSLARDELFDVAVTSDERRGTGAEIDGEMLR